MNKGTLLKLSENLSKLSAGDMPIVEAIIRETPNPSAGNYDGDETLSDNEYMLSELAMQLCEASKSLRSITFIILQTYDRVEGLRYWLKYTLGVSNGELTQVSTSGEKILKVDITPDTVESVKRRGPAKNIDFSLEIRARFKRLLSD